MTEFVDDELPLPPFAEMFGEGPMSNKKKKQKMGGSRGDGLTGEESTGRWTPDEHRLFLEGIMLYGKDWKKMQPLIKTRTLVQIRTHAQKVFKKIGLKKMNLKKNGPMEVTAAQIAMLQQHLEAEDGVNIGGMRNIHPPQHGMGGSGSSSSSAAVNSHPQSAYTSASMMMPLSASQHQAPANMHPSMQSSVQQQQHQQQQQQHHQQHQQHQMLTMSQQQQHQQQQQQSQQSQPLSHQLQQQPDTLVGPPHLNSTMVPDSSSVGTAGGSGSVGMMAAYGGNGNSGSVNQGYSTMQHYSQQQHQHMQQQHGSNGNNSSGGNGAYTQMGGYYGSVGAGANSRQQSQHHLDEDDEDDLGGVDDEELEDEDDDNGLMEAERHELLSLVNHGGGGSGGGGGAGGVTSATSSQYPYLQQQQQQQAQQYHQNYNLSGR